MEEKQFLKLWKVDFFFCHFSFVCAKEIGHFWASCIWQLLSKGGDAEVGWHLAEFCNTLIIVCVLFFR